MTIHGDHPFLDPEPDPVRQFRGRVGGRVSLWTSGAEDGRAGLTVSSLMVAPGQPSQVLALLDPDSDLAAVLEETGVAVVQLLDWRHRDLADMFAGLTPAPGGAFQQATWRQTDWGPVLADVDVWAGVSLGAPRFPRSTTVGWSWLVCGAVEELRVGDESEPLLHRRGRYQRP
ncbi:MAG TPA: flavin reductase family protein [Nocardioidaceae bacterium]|nr:flavin reductase family protein [Nocardioidaceae bacterium]